MNACYLGIDPTNSERRPSAWATLDDDAHVLSIGAASSNGDILALAERWRPAAGVRGHRRTAAVGLTSLDDPVAARGLPTGRTCERELKRLGIGCFYTTPNSIIKLMVYRSIVWRQNLEARGILVLEVYPYASKRRMFGNCPMPKKASSSGRAWLQTSLLPFIPDLAGSPPLSHDTLDALIAAYTGLLHARGQAQGMGCAEEGLLWIPLISTAAPGSGACN